MRVIQERSQYNTPTVSYTRGTDLSGSLEGGGGIGGLLGRSHGYSAGNWSKHNFYHADRNGNVTYLVNSSQTRSASYRYDPYGNALIASELLSYLGGLPNTYRFSSKMLDLTSGLYYYGYRWYAPNVQRWPNRDHIGELGGLNLYSYVYNSPINLIDPFGLDPDDTVILLPGGGLQPRFLHVDRNGKRNVTVGSPNPNWSAEELNRTIAEQYRNQYLLMAAGEAGGAALGAGFRLLSASENASTAVRLGKGIVCDNKVVAHAPIEALTSHEQMAMQTGTLLRAPEAGTPGLLVQGAEAFTYSAQGSQVFVTGSANFSMNVSRNTVQVVTIYVKGLK